MGNYVIDIEAVGGHGCQREVPDGSVVLGCGEPNCPDCLTRRFVEQLILKGNSLVRARLIHWPGQPNTVIDDLKPPYRRVGSF